MDTPPSDAFKPFSGPGGGGRKRILISNSLARFVDIKKSLRPLVSNASAGTSGSKETKVVPLGAHPITPNERDSFVYVFEAENVTMRSVDPEGKAGSEAVGKAKWQLPITEETAGLLNSITECVARKLSTSGPSTFVEYIQNQGRGGVTEQITNVPSLALWWSTRESMHLGFVKEVRQALGLAKEDPSKWSEDDHKAFESAFYQRIANEPRNPDMMDPGIGASMGAIREFSSARRPTLSTAAYHRDDGTWSVSVAAMNYKNGREISGNKRGGQTESLPQTTFVLYDPVSDTSKLIESTSQALSMLQHSEKGAAGLRSSPFNVNVHKAIFSIKHWWVNAKGINCSLDFELLKFSIAEEEANPYASMAGVVSKKRVTDTPAAEPEAKVAKVEDPPAEVVPLEVVPPPPAVEEVAVQKDEPALQKDEPSVTEAPETVAEEDCEEFIPVAKKEKKAKTNRKASDS